MSQPHKSDADPRKEVEVDLSEGKTDWSAVLVCRRDLHADLAVSSKDEVATEGSSKSRCSSAHHFLQNTLGDLVERSQKSQVPGMLVGSAENEVELFLKAAEKSRERIEQEVNNLSPSIVEKEGHDDSVRKSDLHSIPGTGKPG